MTLELILFLILSVIAVVSALAMLISSNAVYSALFLIMNFAVVSVFYLALNAPFIAMVQVTVYAGAIMVLFMFVI
ncbi:MAG: NADH-quinone oxidoreductase subunit J, partial [Chloroflexota bacterium]